jgi:thiol-disulfide isomerase/thioredoxin
MKIYRLLDFNCRAFAMVFLLCSMAHAKEPSPPPKPLREGVRIYMEQEHKPFPDIHVQDARGTQIALSESSGMLRIVTFWATWCTPCVEEMPDLQTLQQRYAGKLSILAINENIKGFEDITPFLQHHNIDGLTHYWDEDNVAFAKLHMQGLPMSFLIDAHGNLIATALGKIDWLGADMRGVIEGNLKN